jgi:radical SAM superfamily enzyme YgiQ (UPF0313 family)
MKQSHPHIKIVMGGWMPTLAPARVLSLTGCDVVVRGECERTLPALLQEIEKDEWDIKGLSFPLPGTRRQIVHTSNSEPLTSHELDRLPFPRYDVLPPLHLYQPLSVRDPRIKPCFSIEASRGCTNHQCLFCWNTTQNCETDWRAKSPARVVNEIRRLVDTYGPPVLFFTDDSFGAELEWVTKFTSLMQANFQPGEIEYTASMRVDSIHKGLLHDLYLSGMRTIFHGIESGSPRCWKTLKKNFEPHITPKSILELIEREVEHKISPICSFIVAFPGETEEDIDQTISMCTELAKRGSIFSLQIVAPPEGTALYEHYKTLIEPYDVYHEFGESENLSPELRTVLGDKLNVFKDHLQDFKMIRLSMPMQVFKQKYALLGEIASLEGPIRDRFNVFSLSKEGLYVHHRSKEVNHETTTIWQRLKRRIRS